MAISSYQGGHVEYFSYLVELLRERGAGHVKVYGGGGGVIVPEEIALLHARGVARIFSPEDGQRLGLPGMINIMIRECDVDLAADRPGIGRRGVRRRPRRAGPGDHPGRGRPAAGRAAGPRRPRTRCRCWASPAPAAPASPR